MATTLTKGTTVLTLSDHLLWTDEFAWTRVQQSTSFSVGGAVLFDRGVKLAGRPITLQAGPDWGWIPRSTALSLYAWANEAGAAMTLLYRGVSYAVVFDVERGPLEVVPVGQFADPADADICAVSLRFITTA